ncbi:DUF3363 domain-containing protein [Pseudomonas aeruginosa]|nr:DUF3363 domain-containing protein [Pseudomonas aeruginosa]
MDAQLLLDPWAGHPIAPAQASIGGNVELRHDEQAEACQTARGALDASQNQMDNIRRQIVITTGDEDLGARETIGPIITLNRRGPKGFSLVPWKPIIESRLGQQITATLDGGGVSWGISRSRGVGI